MATKILAIESSQAMCSVALLHEDKQWQLEELGPRRHAELILPMVDRVLQDAGMDLAELDTLAFGHGPGSFTGIRIAASVVQGLAFGAEKDVVPVSSLQALAHSAFSQDTQLAAAPLACAVDARMAEMYAAVYQFGEHAPQALVADSLLSNEEFLALFEAVVPPASNLLCASLSEQQKQQMQASNINVRTEYYARAIDIAVLAQWFVAQGQQLTAEHALPRYLRGSDAWVKHQANENTRSSAVE